MEGTQQSLKWAREAEIPPVIIEADVTVFDLVGSWSLGNGTSASVPVSLPFLLLPSQLTESSSA